MIQEAYHLSGEIRSAKETAENAINCFTNAGMIIERSGEPYCVLEGLGAHVKPDGTHEIGTGKRPDCTGEAAFMFYLKSRLDNDSTSLRIADGFRRFPTDGQIKSGIYKGMVSWTPNAFFACYQDDVARGYLLPELWRAYLSGDHSELPGIKMTLDYLLSTTGSDHLRMCRTDYLDPEIDLMTYMSLKRDSTEKWDYAGGSKVTAAELRSMPAGCPSAHYNAFYMASLLLYGKITGETTYIEVGKQGLTTLMSYYPETAREHSQTQELRRSCRR